MKLLKIELINILETKKMYKDKKSELRKEVNKLKTYEDIEQFTKKLRKELKETEKDLTN